jgi:hypothetical protein
MSAVRKGCRAVITALQRDGMLARDWTRDEATDLFWTLLSVRNWELPTIECGWSTSEYIGWMQTLSKRTFVQGSDAPTPVLPSEAAAGP